MKIKDFKSMVREAVKKSFAENQPAPAKPERGTETIPSKPGEKQKPRRTFEPKPGAEPKPKAMNENEKQIVDKIVQRMRDKKDVNEAESAFKIDPSLAAKIHDILEKEGIETGMTKSYFFHFLNDRL